MSKSENNWGGKRSGSGRKSKRDGCKKMETFISPELKQQAISKAKQLHLSQSEYLKHLIENDIKQ